MVQVTEEQHKKAIEHQQVAGLLCLDIDLLVEVCEGRNISAEDMLWHIRDLRDKKEEMIRDESVRSSRYAACAFLFGLDCNTSESETSTNEQELK